MGTDINEPQSSIREQIRTQKKLDQRRQQYTLKGVETEAVELMRLAADSQGMKIGHWVSERLKEAAKKALVETEKQTELLQSIAAGCEGSALRTLTMNASSMPRVELEERVRRLELEVQELYKGQRDMLQLVVSKLL